MNHSNVISLPANEALLKGQLVEINSEGKAIKATTSSSRFNAIGVVLHDVDPSEINDAAAIHLFSGIVLAEVSGVGGAVSIGDIVGTRDDSAHLQNSGTIRQVGISLEAVPVGEVHLVRVVAS